MQKTDSYQDISMIYKALSKPAFIMGVDYDYFLISGTATMLAFIFTDKFLALLLFLPLHLIGWILCQLDPHIFRIISVRAMIGVTKNQSLWSCQSYDAF